MTRQNPHSIVILRNGGAVLKTTLQDLYTLRSVDIQVKFSKAEMQDLHALLDSIFVYGGDVEQRSFVVERES